MFISVDKTEVPLLPPEGNTFGLSDWSVLSKFWHPLVFSSEVCETPVSARLLDVDLVVYRTASGISVALDQCPHRGTRLSHGEMRAGELVCPMHGLRFDGQGSCTGIPSHPGDEISISPQLRLTTFLVEERYGIVWTNLSGDPLWPLPEWEGIKDDRLKNVYIPSDTWNASAPRHVENFNDIAHFPWVHSQTFGAENVEPVPIYSVDETEYGLSFEIPYLEGGNRFPDDVESEDRQVTYRYELTFPFSTLLIISPDDSDYVQYFADTVCPVSAYETKIFQVVTDTTGSPDEDFLIPESLAINNEDKTLVEGQRPRSLPLNLQLEGHIPADRMSIKYRRALSERFKLGCHL